MEFARKCGELKGDALPYTLNGRTHALARKSLLRYNRDSRDPPPKIAALYKEAAEWAHLEFGRYINGSRVMGYDEVIEHQDTSKSPGVPWTTLYTTKHDYALSPHAGEFDKYWASLVTDDLYPTLCSQIVKEQLQSEADNLAGKVRTVTAMCQNHVMAHMMLCLDQNERFRQAHSVTASRYGMSMQGGGAHRLVCDMECATPGSIELDGKRFDAKFKPFHFDIIRDLRVRWLCEEARTPDNVKRLHALYHQLATSPFVSTDGTVIGRVGGNPSGQACTTVDNTIKNFLDMCVLYMLSAPKDQCTYMWFKKLIRLCIYGDDVNISVHRSARHWFNRKAIEECSVLIDMEYEFAHQDFVNFADTSFLGHSFRELVVPGTSISMWFPILKLDKALCGYICWGSDNDSEASRVVALCGYRVETFCDEVARHIFSGWADRLRREYQTPGSPLAKAWLSWLSDRALWSLYTGIHESDLGYGYSQGAPRFNNEENKYPVVQSMSGRNRKKPAGRKKGGAKYQPFVGPLRHPGPRRLVKVTKGRAPKGHARAQRGLTFGKKYGAKFGSWIGGQAQHWLGSITGMGAYKVNSNSLLSSSGPPVFGNRGGGIRVQHREFLADISGSVAFAIANYYLNPGLAQTFPWLSNIAYNYEQYRFHGLIFEFKTTSATAVSSTNTALGTVVMATDYDDLDAGFTTKQQMEAYEFSVSSVPSSSVIHPVECSPRETPLPKLWVRTGAYSNYTTVDPRLYDLGNFQIATVGMQAAAVVGELWVSYDVEFYKPKLITPFNGEVLSYSAYGQANTGSALMYAPTVSPLSTLPVTLTGLVGNAYTTLTFPNPGQYLVLASAGAATSVSNFPTWTAVSNCTLLQQWSSGTGTNTNSTFSSGGGTANAATMAYINITASNGVAGLTGNVTLVGGCFYNIYVTTVASGFKFSNHALEGIASKKLRELEERIDELTSAKATGLAAMELCSSDEKSDDLDEVHSTELSADQGRRLEADISSGRLRRIPRDESWTDVGVRGNTLDCHMRKGPL